MKISNAGFVFVVTALTAPIFNIAMAQSGDAMLEEIVVTAQRTESLLSKTPVAVTALSGGDLDKANLTNATQLGDYIPNLSIDKSDGFRITIRGVTSNDGSEKGDPSAAFMLDGVYLSRPQAQDVSFYDIARVEVLRGPQGTLWGRNTTAGLVHVISNKPSHTFEAALNATVGNYDTRQATGMINVPVSDSVALRGAFSYDRRDSYLIQKDPPGLVSQFGDDPWRNNLSFRLQGLFDFTDTISLLLRTDYSTMKGSYNSAGAIPASDIYRPGGDPSTRLGGLSSDDLRTRTYALTSSAAQDDNTWGVSSELNWNVGPVQLTYVGSYRKLTLDEGQPLAFGAPFSLNTTYEFKHWQNSQEVRVATTGSGPLKAQGGVYYFKERSSVDFWLINTPFAPVDPVNQPGVFWPWFGFPQDPTISESYGVFGQATYSLTDVLRLTAGVRYSHDYKERTGATAFQQAHEYNPATDIRLSNSAQRTDSKVTWRVGLDFDLNPSTLLYGSVATGYKAGGFGDGCEAGKVDRNGILCNQPRPPADLYYKPETLTAYETGLKTTLGGRLRLSGDAFYYDYTNMQLSGISNVSGAPSLVTRNAGKARVMGVEFETTYKLAEHHRVDASLTWLDAKYKDYTAGGAQLDYSGRYLDRSPKFTASLGYAYTWPLNNGATIEAAARSKYTDSYVITVYSAPQQFKQPGYSKTDVSLTYSAANDRWNVKAFARNVEDKVVITGADPFGSVWTGEPRTYGVGGGVKF